MMATASDALHEARWWETVEDGRILCTLCPRYCKIPEGSHGFCFIRRNIGGTLYNLGYGRSTGFAVDPIEKKPLNHFLPGTTALSFGTAGCNLGCKFCQNWSISKAQLDDRRSLAVGPEMVVQLAIREGSASIAYTYNDPVIWAEYVVDIARVAREFGVKNVMVTAGYMDGRARADVYPFIDAANVDLKAFSQVFYKKITFSDLQPVLDTLVWIHRESDVWLEITNLLIPDLNDSTGEVDRMTDWILENLGPDVPIHFTAFHPDFKMTDRPRTPAETLRRSRRIALAKGLRFVYVGNVHDREGQSTCCPACRTPLIERDWHAVRLYRLDPSGNCPDCGASIPGRWETGRLSAGTRRHSLP